MGNCRENTAENFKKVLILSNICWNFDKKIEEYLEKIQGNFEHLWGSF